jgi:hypothetical protein
MWKKKWGLWVFDEDGRKTADRPHWLTLAIGFLSSALAFLAFVISVESLRTSERSLKIGTRAYVSVLAGDMQFFNYGVVQHDNSGGQHCIVRMDLSAAIQNAGNSPASQGSFKAKYRLPKGWREAPDWVKQNLGSDSIGTIGPKSTLNWSYTHLFELTPEIYDAFRNIPLRQHFIYMDAEVDYQNVFAETSTVKWCWVAATNEKTTQTTDCQSALKLVLGRGAPPELLRQ